MNKDEANKLAVETELYGMAGGTKELLAFANACEKIGMEKAAKICDEASWIDANAHLYSDAIRESAK